MIDVEADPVALVIDGAVPRAALDDAAAQKTAFADFFQRIGLTDACGQRDNKNDGRNSFHRIGTANIRPPSVHSALGPRSSPR